MKLILIVLLMISILSCATKPYQKTYTVYPEEKKVCRIDDKLLLKEFKIVKEKKCFSLDHKTEDGKYLFGENGGYILISLRAIKEAALKLAEN